MKIIKDYFPITFSNYFSIQNSYEKTKKSTSELNRVFQKALNIGYGSIDITLDITLNAILIPIRYIQGIVLKIVNIFKNSNDFVKQHYYISGNVSSIEEADVVCLSEQHKSNWQRKINGFVINHYSRLNDIALEECYVPSKKAYMYNSNFQAKYAHKWILSSGWDLKGGVEYFLNAVSFSLTVFSIKQFYSRFKKEILFSLYKKVPSFLDNSNLHNDLLLIEKDAIISNFFSKLLCFSVLLVANSLLGSHFYRRNKNMCETIDYHLSARRKVFVLGGAAHFPGSSKWFHFISIIRANPFLIPTKRFLEKKKYVILTPKNLFSRS